MKASPRIVRSSFDWHMLKRQRLLRYLWRSKWKRC